ncbi:MAG: amino acid permease [Verrucomicrobia bacterium]|nr:amino acid permease [Verrucomicrobiota bacterium]MDE3097989.1 amino acid permease [Verrucomicrobiota bacterium]
MNLFARRRVADLQAEALKDQRLKRVLGPWNLTSLGIGAIIGAGIFVLTGQAAAQYAGPAIVFSFILSGLACAFAGLCYAEFASMIPVSGSAYTYGYATLGEFIAWIIGWDLILEYLFAASTVAVGWSGYVVSFLKDFGIVIPPAFTSAPYDHQTPAGAHWWDLWQLFVTGWTHTGAVVNVPAMVVVGVVTILLVIGIKESANFNNVIVALKLAVILAFIGFGAAYINRQNWHPFVPPAVATPFGWQFGWHGVLRGAGVIFFAYIGFDAVSTAAQEAKNPRRDMPIGLLGSLGVCTILYIAVSLVLTGIINYTRLNVSAPIALAVNSLGPSLAWLELFIKIGAIAGLSSVILVLLLGQPRIFYTMSKDGLLPPVFSVVHPRFRTPWIAQILTGAVAMVIAGLFPIGLLGQLVSIGTLLAFAIVCAGIFALRFTDPQIQRPFRAPLFWLTSPLGFAFCIFLMSGLPQDTWARLIIWMAIGIVIYFSYSLRHSQLRRSRGPTRA